MNRSFQYVCFAFSPGFDGSYFVEQFANSMILAQSSALVG